MAYPGSGENRRSDVTGTLDRNVPPAPETVSSPQEDSLATGTSSSSGVFVPLDNGTLRGESGSLLDMTGTRPSPSRRPPRKTSGLLRFLRKRRLFLKTLPGRFPERLPKRLFPLPWFPARKEYLHRLPPCRPRKSVPFLALRQAKRMSSGRNLLQASLL